VGVVDAGNAVDVGSAVDVVIAAGVVNGVGAWSAASVLGAERAVMVVVAAADVGAARAVVDVRRATEDYGKPGSKVGRAVVNKTREECCCRGPSCEDRHDTVRSSRWHW